MGINLGIIGIFAQWVIRTKNAQIDVLKSQNDVLRDKVESSQELKARVDIIEKSNEMKYQEMLENQRKKMEEHTKTLVDAQMLMILDGIQSGGGFAIQSAEMLNATIEDCLNKRKFSPEQTLDIVREILRKTIEKYGPSFQQFQSQFPENKKRES